MEALRQVGRALGGPEHVQGPGGNVSIKEGGTLFVKASGRRLLELGTPGAHAAVPLDLARLALQGDREAEARVFRLAPRPSLETYFHALGGAVVAHTHSLGALLVACSGAPRPPGMLAVGYERPGAGLARAVAASLGGLREAVVLLDSHGLIVYAEDVEAAISRALLADRRCREAFGELRPFGDDILAPSSPSPLPGGGWFTRLPPRKIDEVRYLFPDAVVYASVVRVASLSEAPALAEEALLTLGRPLVLAADDGERVQCARTQDELGQAREVALAHDWVEDALRPRGDARYLAPGEPSKIVDMPSEQYRLELTRKNARC